MANSNINTGVNSLPTKVVAALNADNLNVIRVYSYSFTYWNGEQTTAFIIIAETTESRLLLLSCTEAVLCLACVFTPDDRRKSFPADELDPLIKRAESLAGVTETTPTNPETETTTNTETTMTTTDTTDNAPKFEELTHAATNIVLTAENDGDIYRRYVENLVESLAKKVAKGVNLDASTLASSGAVANIIRESIKGMKSSGWTNPVTASDRKQAAAYLANAYISDAIENAEYINA